MSSSQFLETLGRIGCPDVETLRPESIEWVFESKAQSFLSWLCSSITEDNVLSLQDQTDFQSLELRGETIEGEDLETAATSLPSLTENELKLQVEEMRSSIQKLKARKNMLMKHCGQMSVKQMDLKNRVNKMHQAEAHWIKEKTQAQENCRSENSQFGDAMEDLSQSVHNLMKLYDLPDSGKIPSLDGAAHDRNFLSQVDLKSYHEAEAKYSKELTSFTKKQFFVGMADMAGEREETEYNLLDISSPGEGQVAEENQSRNAFFDDCQEFSRLQKIFPKSECARINALVNAKKASSAVHEARAVLHQLKSDVFPKVPNDMSRLRHVAEQNAAESRAESTPLLSSIPDLIQELGGLQGTEILTGDYDLKLKRQDYFTKSQDKIVNHLVCQRARSEFVSMLYDLELKWHKETHGLLSAAKAALETHMVNWQNRKAELDEPDLSEKKFERNVVDTRDTATARLYKLMDGGKEDEKQIYLPVQKVIAKAEELKEEQNSALTLYRTRDDWDLDKVDQLKVCASDCEAVLYSGSSTHSGAPSLTPSQIQAAMTEVAGQLAALESRVMEVVAQVNSKKSDLRNNILQKKERELFVLFHTNPEKLMYVVNGLAERGKTRDLKE